MPMAEKFLQLKTNS